MWLRFSIETCYSFACLVFVFYLDVNCNPYFSSGNSLLTRELLEKHFVVICTEREAKVSVCKEESFYNYSVNHKLKRWIPCQLGEFIAKLRLCGKLCVPQVLWCHVVYFKLLIWFSRFGQRIKMESLEVFPEAWSVSSEHITRIVSFGLLRNSPVQWVKPLCNDRRETIVRFLCYEARRQKVVTYFWLVL